MPKKHPIPKAPDFNYKAHELAHDGDETSQAAALAASTSVITKPQDEWISNSTTLQNDDHLSFQIVGGSLYYFELVLLVVSSAAADLKLAWSLPGKMTWWEENNNSPADLDETSVPVLPTDGTKQVWRFSGVITPTGSGNVTLRWAQNSADLPRTGVLKGSFLRVTVLDAGFSPDQLDGLAAWYRADAITGVPGGGSISTWPDSSGGGYDLTQPTAAKRPTLDLTQGGTGTVAVVVFDGVDDDMASGTNPRLSSQPYTMFIFARRGNTTNGKPMTDGIDASHRCHVVYNTANNKEGVFFGNAVAETTFTDDSAWHTWTVVAKGANTKVWRDRTSSTLSTNPVTQAPNGLLLGSNRLAGGADYANVHITEVIIYARELTDEERTKVWDYLEAKYATLL